MKESDVASTSGLAALAICDALLKELKRKGLFSNDEIKETLEIAMADVADRGDKGHLAAKLISHLREIFV